MRKPVNKARDRLIARKTANRVHKKNLAVRTMRRGGVRE